MREDLSGGRGVASEGEARGGSLPEAGSAKGTGCWLSRFRPRAPGGVWGSVFVAAFVGVPLLFGARTSLLPQAMVAQAGPLVVSNSRAQQLTDGTKRVEFLYDFAGAPASGATVSIKVSADGGTTYSIVPAANTLSGDIGPGVQNGTNRRIVWNAAATLPAGTFSNLFKAEITATAEECVVTCTATVAASGTVGQPVSFAATATATSCAGAVSYRWDFGDGTGVSTEQNPAHTYTSAWTFGWTLTVTADGVSCTRTGTIKVEAAGGQEITVTLPGGVPLVMVRIPGGTFQMGSPDSERGRDSSEGPVHQVTLTSDYYLGKYEVTQGQWKAVMGSAMSMSCGSYGVGDSYPVYCVSWDDIAGSGGFLEKLNAHLTSTGQAGAGKYRLPTEAEWERAARGGTQTRFSFGEVLECGDDCGACAAADPYMWWCGNLAEYGSKPVGTKRPNPYGLCDMHGDVWELCQDWYGSYTSSPQTNPTGPDSYWGKVTRGGLWGREFRHARSAARGAYNPEGRDGAYGFRLARTL